MLHAAGVPDGGDFNGCVADCNHVLVVEDVVEEKEGEHSSGTLLEYSGSSSSSDDDMCRLETASIIPGAVRSSSYSLVSAGVATWYRSRVVETRPRCRSLLGDSTTGQQ